MKCAHGVKIVTGLAMGSRRTNVPWVRGVPLPFYLYSPCRPVACTAWTGWGRARPTSRRQSTGREWWTRSPYRATQERDISFSCSQTPYKMRRLYLVTVSRQTAISLGNSLAAGVGVWNLTRHWEKARAYYFSRLFRFKSRFIHMSAKA